MKSRNLNLLVLVALLITPVLAAAPTSNFYLVPTDKMVYSMVPYDAMVYQDGTYTIAVNRTGAIISSVLTSAHTDDIPIQAAVNSGRRVYVGGAVYYTSRKISLNNYTYIYGNNMDTAIWNTADGDVFYSWNTGHVTIKDIYVNMNGKHGAGINLTGDNNDYNCVNIIDNAVVISSLDYGILIQNSQTSRIINSISEYNGIAGIKLLDCRYIYVTGLMAEVNGIAILLVNTSTSDISHSELNSYPTAISLINSHQNTISDIHYVYTSNGVRAITLDASSYLNKISDCQIFTDGTNSSGIISAGSWNTFIGNTFDGLPSPNLAGTGIKAGDNDIISSNQIFYATLAVDLTSSTNASVTGNQFLTTTDISGGTTPKVSNNNWEVYP